MTSAAVGFVNCKMIWKLAGVVRFVLFRSRGCRSPHSSMRSRELRAFRFEMQLLNQMRCFHCDRDTGAIIGRPVPRSHESR